MRGRRTRGDRSPEEVAKPVVDPDYFSRFVRRARAALAGAGIDLYFLQPYEQELNEIEATFRQAKYQEMPQRSHTSREGLRGGGDWPHELQLSLELRG